MAYYQMLVPEKDEIFIPAINRLAQRSEAKYCTENTEDGLIYELNFPNNKLLESFKQALQQRLSKKIE